jgi:hypothetical protein
VIRTLPARQAYLDGGLCGVRTEGVASFALIQNAAERQGGGRRWGGPGHRQLDTRHPHHVIDARSGAGSGRVVLDSARARTGADEMLHILPRSASPRLERRAVAAVETGSCPRCCYA